MTDRVACGCEIFENVREIECVTVRTRDLCECKNYANRISEVVKVDGVWRCVDLNLGAPAHCRLFNRPIFGRVELLARTLGPLNSRVGGECANKSSQPTILERVLF
jgi:hypothetical protein